MDETIEWLRGRPYYEGQIEDRRTVPGREATLADCDVEERLADALSDRGIDDFYAHQAEAVGAVRDGDDVVLATETASGKSLAYTVPAFERAMDRRATTLYVAPQVALINDQTETLSDLAGDLGFASGVTVDQYTGRQSKSEKEAIRERQPTVLLTTPDMLHYGILPHAHRLWDWFFQRLETVVIDEVHEYRGVFGSHVSLVMRRLQRVVERFQEDADRDGDSDAGPEWICCSATIGNPVEHAAAVTGQPEDAFDLVDEDASASGPRHWCLWNPPKYDDGSDGGDGWGDSGRRRSPHVESKQLFVDLVQRGLQTVVFAGSRQVAERYASECADELQDRGEHELSRSVGAYQAALTDERRRDLEDRLKSGDLRGVWSTNALELGVDVGGLDAVILDGYPGTRMQTFQQAGRAGRGTDPALVVLVPGEDQLDQYVARNPGELFDHAPEQAVTNPENDQLMPAHVCSAARETWLKPDDDRHFGEGFPDLVADLESSGDLQRRTTDAGVRWTYAGDGSPQHDTSLRTVDDREVRLMHGGDVIARLPFGDALRDAHPGAIYHHQGTTYEVVDLDLDRNVAELDRTWADYFTRTLHDKEITVEADLREDRLAAREDVPVRFAEVTMRKQITGYERKDATSGETVGQRSLDLPETTLETKALYFTVPGDVERAMLGRSEAVAADGGSGAGDEGGPASAPEPPEDAGDLPGGIHAAEHAMISMFPFGYLCDRRDIGGLSTPVHPHTGKPTVFVYDGYPGGVGLARSGFEGVDDLMATTLSMLRSCDCADGCPACVQSPHCGNANDPLDKGLATYLLAALTGDGD
ncbi:DEAD/DEAH box helicase [Halomicrobium salinisoli]|uniref:DEAD/DEAH box helicase n=1 Tax=Halomicrobium salinisoli TaxID=2878391 RepID=UPI001CF03E89|nr:DEAD/DEAH box helicase [Halomicrobium salinisoli]